jgi:hypothetical protein
LISLLPRHDHRDSTSWLKLYRTAGFFVSDA